MENCVFCKIIDKQIPAAIIYEDDDVMAFKDINPVAPVHVLIVPKMHIVNMQEISENNAKVLISIHLAAQKVAEITGVAQSGYRLINNCGADAGQTIHHLHYHLLGGIRLGEKLI